MNLGLEGRSALVCASTGGLGLASARALAAEGARVAVTGRREAVAQQGAGTLPDAGAPVDILVLNGPGPAPGLASELDGPGVASAVDLLVRPQVELVRCLLP